MYVRCSYCQARRTLKRAPAEYVRLPRCRSTTCHNRSKRRGRPTSYYTDHYRTNRERGAGAAKPCYPGRGGCDGLAYPHRRGCRGCIHHPQYHDDMRLLGAR